MSHHANQPPNIMDFNLINTYRLAKVMYLLEKLKNIQDGGSTMLDKSMVVYGSPMGDSHVHTPTRCPLFVAGHAGGKLQGNMHIKTADGTPMANAMLGLMHRLGMDDMESFGDSTGDFSFSAPSVVSDAL